jgi:hypothetical protein
MLPNSPNEKRPIVRKVRQQTNAFAKIDNKNKKGDTHEARRAQVIFPIRRGTVRRNGIHERILDYGAERRCLEHDARLFSQCDADVQVELVGEETGCDDGVGEGLKSKRHEGRF